MRRLAAGIAIAVALGAAFLWQIGLWPFDEPRAEFRLTASGKGELVYSCTLTAANPSAQNDARSRAEAAHAEFQIRLKELAEAAATEVQTGMTVAAISNDTSGIKAASDAYHDKVKALRVDLEAKYGCRVDSTLVAPAP